VVLMTSGEHYGAVLNKAFDFERYLDVLAADGLNLTRTFAGTYRELPGEFSIADNTLAPAAEAFACPWQRVDDAGGFRRGGRFDLQQWDEAYFDRLRTFLAEAARREIVVELVLFCFMYNDDLWHYSPMHADNAVSGGGAGSRLDVYAPPADNPLIGVQEALVRRIVTELNAFDNLYYEIINEPYCFFDHTAAAAWQHRMVDVIVRTERSLPHRHLIAMNVENRAMRVADLHPDVSIVNFHYAEPEAVLGNYHWNRVIADDETGFKGQAAAPYRREMWAFMFAGGGVFSHLDYSFTVAHPDGTAPIIGETPGFGSPAWRREVAVCRQFMEGLDLPAMAPHNEAVRFHGGDSETCRVLADPGRTYAVYAWGGKRAMLALSVPGGRYRATWIRPADGKILREETCDLQPPARPFTSPVYAEDIVLKLVRT
ncbi:MAG: hypothetical protein GX591_06130, partial [Planctomycetes bacterium]|nr:hypothetical protein [Planctomycetota bacterium]